ncbi:MAG: ROK family protein [Candidatus Nitrosopelagicus sp.]|nr:ROK family protein [Candidatus Nitrosopelagicus sp.]
MYQIGIDLGGTKIEGIVVDDNYKTIARKRIPTNQVNGYDSILESIKILCMQLAEKTSVITQESTKFTSIGVCTPGALSLDSGLIKNSNTQCLIGKDLQNDLKNILHQDISIENDANCFALAEAKLGVGKDHDVIFGVIMGTGVGGGIIIDGKIHHGRTNIAGEWGHHCLHNEGNNCYCGNKGCVETYISGPALEKSWHQLSGLNQSLPEIIQNSDNPNFDTWKNIFLENFSSALTNVVDILDPDMIILGGGVSNIDFLYDEGKSAVYEKIFSDIVDTPIVKNELGDSAGVFGACLL